MHRSVSFTGFRALLLPGYRASPVPMKVVDARLGFVDAPPGADDVPLAVVGAVLAEVDAVLAVVGAVLAEVDAP